VKDKEEEEDNEVLGRTACCNVNPAGERGTGLCPAKFLLSPSSSSSPSQDVQH